MTIKTGMFLKAAPLLDDSVFRDAIILVTEYNSDGAMGFVINQRFPRALNELEEFSNSKRFDLFTGGPVDQEHLFFMHQRPDLIEGGTMIVDNIYWGGNFQMALAYMNDGIISGRDMKIFIGYCGWSYAQLEEEIEEGSWLLQEANTYNVFTA